MKTVKKQKVEEKLLEHKYKSFIAELAQTEEQLEFLLDNLGYSVVLDHSRESLVVVEKIYWEVYHNIPQDLLEREQLAQLIGQYLGILIVEHTNAKWVQCKDNNHLYGQPCLDGFGNKKWDRIYPMRLAVHLHDLKKQSRAFLGVKDNTVFVSHFDKAVAIFECNI